MRGVTKVLRRGAHFQKFLLTRLMRGVTRAGLTVDGVAGISTHTPHARRDACALMRVARYKISTHTPHARRDRITVPSMVGVWISTHTPHARRDLSDGARLGDRFLLTRLMRGVTITTG